MMNIIEQLKGGDLRSIGDSNRIVDQIGNDPKLFKQVFEGIFDNDSLIRMRSSDVIEKVSKKYPFLLLPYKDRILNNLNSFKQQEVRWHIAQLLSYLEFNNSEAELIFNVLQHWINTEKSKIVIVNSLEALTLISLRNSNITDKTIKLVNKYLNSGIPSIVVRCRKLIKYLNN